MTSTENIIEFKKLIERYEEITLNDIVRVKSIITADNIKWAATIANYLTGYGSLLDCALCMAIENNCDYCIYTNYSIINTKPMVCALQDTYVAISKANTPEKLLAAFKARAKFMRQILIDNNL